jgi:protein O-mannosyl-transferase
MNERTRMVLLAALAILVYANTLFNQFAVDDELYVLRNPAVTSPSVHGLLDPIRMNKFRPLTFATLAVNWAVAGPHALGYHLFNILLHAAVTLLLYLLLKTLLDPLPQASTIAFVASLLFAVHPIHTEAVAYIVGRAELLAAGFVMAAWLLHQRDKPVAAIACLFLALMAKESAAVFLPLVIVGDFACGKQKPLRRYAWIAAAVGLYLAAFWKIEGGRFKEGNVAFLDNPLAFLPAGTRILNALRIAWKYVALQLYPAKLSYDYSYSEIPLYTKWRPNLAALAATICVLAAWAWALWTRRKAWALAGTLYLVGFAATSNVFIATGTIMGERLAYLPSAGFCLAIALLWMHLANHQSRLAWIVLCVILATLGARTFVRNRDWYDNGSLFLADLKSAPGSAEIHGNAGVIYMTRGQLQEAREEFRKSLLIYPDSPAAVEAYGLTDVRMGDDQEGCGLLENALATTPKDDIDYDFRAVNLAAEFMKLGRSSEALKLLDTEIQQSRADTRAWSNRAVIHQQLGELELARSDAKMAVRLDPANKQAQDVLKGFATPSN